MTCGSRIGPSVGSASVCSSPPAAICRSRSVSPSIAPLTRKLPKSDRNAKLKSCNPSTSFNRISVRAVAGTSLPNAATCNRKSSSMMKPPGTVSIRDAAYPIGDPPSFTE